MLIILFNTASKLEANPILTNLSINKNLLSITVGREEELKQVERIISNKHSVSIGGLPGSGKSHLAKSYAIKHENEYDIIWIINGKNLILKEYKIFAQAINASFKQEYIDLNYSGIVFVNSLKEFLRKTDYKWLIIYDDYTFNDENEKFFPRQGSKKNYLLIENSGLADINLKEMLFSDRVKLFKNISQVVDQEYIKDIITTCHLDNTQDLVHVANKKQRWHPIILSFKNKNTCLLSVQDLKNQQINEILLQLKYKSLSSYQLVQYLSMLSYLPVNINFAKELYLNAIGPESDFHNDIDILISQHLLYYYKNNDYIMLPKKIQSVTLDDIMRHKEKKLFKKLVETIVRYIKSNDLLGHQVNAGEMIYDHIDNLIDFGKKLDCGKEVLDLYFQLIDYHIKFDRNIREIKRLLQSAGNLIDKKQTSRQAKIQYLSKLSNYYFILGELNNSLKIELELSKLLHSNNYFHDKTNKKYDVLLNKIMLLKIYSNMGDLENCELIGALDLGMSNLEMKFLYLKPHYLEVKSYIKYLKSDLIGALEDINHALTMVFDLGEKLHIESNIYYTCAHLFAKKYLYMSEMGLDTSHIDEIYNKIYLQAIDKNDKSVACIKMVYGYIKGNTENINVGIENIKSSINIYKELYKYHNNKNLSIAYMLLGDLYVKNNETEKAERYYNDAIRVLKKCYIQYKTHDYIILLKKLIAVAKINANYFLVKNCYRNYLDVFGDKHYTSKEFLDLIEL